MNKVELAILIVLGLALVWMDYPLWLGICVAAPAILGGGEEDEDKQRNSSGGKRSSRSNAA